MVEYMQYLPGDSCIVNLNHSVIYNKNYNKRQHDTDTCRQCTQKFETIQYITSGCRKLTQTDHK